MNKNFREDFRVSNPKLHMLYVKLAVRNLYLFDKAISTFENQGNTSLSSVIVSLYTERQKLVEADAAHADADEIIKLATGKLKRPLNNE